MDCCVMVLMRQASVHLRQRGLSPMEKLILSAKIHHFYKRRKFFLLYDRKEAEKAFRSSGAGLVPPPSKASLFDDFHTSIENALAVETIVAEHLEGRGMDDILIGNA